MRPLIFLILSIVLLTTPATVYSGQVYEDRHTIGFPEETGASLNMSSRDLEALLESLRNLSSIASSCRDVACIQNRSQEVSRASSTLASSGVIDKDVYTALSILSGSPETPDLYTLLRDPELIRILSQLNNTDPRAFSELARSYLGRIDEMFLSGRISYREYVAALELLRRMSLEKGDRGLYDMISSREAEVFQKIVEGSYSSLLSRIISGAPGLSGRYATDNISLPGPLQETGGLSLLPQTPLLTLPPLPHVPLYIVLLFSIAGALVVVMAAMYASGIRPLEAISRRLSGRPLVDPGSLGEAPVPVKIYWAAVSILSRRIPRLENETHREYLEKVSRTGGPGVSGFARVTMAYEKCRFGGVSGPEVERESVEGFEEMRRGAG